MEIEIIPLAQKKIKQRQISYEWIKETIESPDRVVAGYGGREVRQKLYVIRSRNKLLRVVYEVEDDKIIVVTAYLTSKIEKYGGKDEGRI
jgi:mRNA-degrading endonuclease RelE of RelBE toxin-antitoxin system